jgi:hypothetical protein
MVTTRSRSGPIALSDTSAESGGVAGTNQGQIEVSSRRRSSTGRKQQDSATQVQPPDSLEVIHEEQEVPARSLRNTRTAAGKVHSSFTV